MNKLMIKLYIARNCLGIPSTGDKKRDIRKRNEERIRERQLKRDRSSDFDRSQ